MKPLLSRKNSSLAGWGRASIVGLLFAGIQLVSGQSTPDMRDVLWLDTLEKEAFRDSVAAVYGSLLMIHDYSVREQVARKLFVLTARKDEIAHIQSLVYQVMLFENKDPSLFEKAYKIAEKHNRIDGMNFVEYSRGLYYIARKQYDSAMVHILRYRDSTPTNLQDEGYRNIHNLLGDVYYNARLYDQAIDIYAELLDQYQKENNWNFYRPYVMMNNLGQIAYNRGDYQEAERLFNRSLTLAEEHLREYYLNNTLSYIRIKLAETALMTNHPDKAASLLQEAEAYPRETIKEDVVQEYLYVWSRLLFAQGDFRGAETIARQLLPLDSMRFGEYRFIPESYRLLSEIAFRNGDFQKSCSYMRQYQQITDSLRAQEHLAQSMIILADRNHEETRQALEKSRRWIYNLVAGLSFLLLILVVILFFYQKLYRSKLALVRKTIETSAGSAFPEVNPGDSDPPSDGAEAQQQQELIRQLQQIIETDVPFLDPKLTVQDMARMLSTNRTYLSRAINQQLKTTFPSFVNEFRIREAIRLITSGYMVQHTQEALARECGFANRTVFSTVFKKHTGVTPSFFAAHYKE